MEYLSYCASLGSNTDAGDVRRRSNQRQLPTNGHAVDLEGPGWLPRWAITSDLELYQAEAAILNPIRPMISQHTVAGLNTICSLHEKVAANDLSAALTAFNNDVSSPVAPSSTVAVAMSGPLPTAQQSQKLRPLDKDCYTSIVFVHGYAGGVANWLPIWKSFAADYDCYAFDLPGFGRSQRPDIVFTSPQHAMDWNLGAFGEWFQAMRIGMGPDDTERPRNHKLILVGHSFGGFLCTNFVMKHPNLVDHLVLAEAWGINRFTPRTPEQEAQRKKDIPATIRFIDSKLDGVYWGKLMRFCGPFARTILPAMRPEFHDTWSPFLDDPKHFYDYSYHCVSKLPFVGEAAFEALRVKESIGATSLPLIDRTAMLPFKNKSSEENIEKKATTTLQAGEGSSLRENFKITMLYGDISWLRHEAIQQFADKLTNENGLDVFLTFIPKAGHMVTVDNVTDFTDELKKRLA